MRKICRCVLPVALIAGLGTGARAQVPDPTEGPPRWVTLVEHEGQLFRYLVPRTGRNPRILTRVDASILIRPVESAVPAFVASVEVDCAEKAYRIEYYQQYDADGRPSALNIADRAATWLPADQVPALLWVERLCDILPPQPVVRFLPDGPAEDGDGSRHEP